MLKYLRETLPPLYKYRVTVSLALSECGWMEWTLTVSADFPSLADKQA